MASKRRLRRKQCGKKIRFPTQKAALDHAMYLKRKGKVTGYVEPYRCRWCHMFHFGHAPKRNHYAR